MRGSSWDFGFGSPLHKAIDSLGNTGLESLENYKASKPVFNLWSSSTRLLAGRCHDLQTMTYFILIIIFFEQIVGKIYPAELQLNKANSSDTEAPFLDLDLSITNGKIYLKCMITG